MLRREKNEQRIGTNNQWLKNDQWTYEKMLNPAMPFKNHSKTITPLLEFQQSTRLTIPSADKDAEQLELPYAVGETANWYSHPGKQFGSFLYS